ncbi:unnamed protein product [Acanthoscelides obtectus]|uniref:Uncharacterized protein n=1 Tax=Acanthoscelides obtectus TaxID=200917 RepID=A0A9P0VV53_ACAOB|nr:unnamed protein product [Acanthoscelides obtectus]CAK1687060.1 hypothetical protein AOBTE_LOCUS36187 [Acanthoscelides obtectus]
MNEYLCTYCFVTIGLMLTYEVFETRSHITVSCSHCGASPFIGTLK